MMGKYHIWDSWSPEIDGWTNDEPEIYDAINMESAVHQYIKNHADEGMADSFTIWICREGEPSPEMIYVRWRYSIEIQLSHGGK